MNNCKDCLLVDTYGYEMLNRTLKRPEHPYGIQPIDDLAITMRQ